MALYQVNISYDGTEYHGYQRQIDQKTIQGAIERALQQIGWKGKTIVSSGRTDTGVHAEEQVAAFFMDWPHSDADLQRALNANLPVDIAIWKVKKRSEPDFHPRFDAKSRIYRYQTYVSQERLPLLERYCWKVWPEPDITMMNSGAAIICGHHDFGWCGSPYETGGRTERIIKEATWVHRNNSPLRIDFRIHGNSFLYHMVRRLVFVLIQLGLGKVNITEVTDAFEGNDNLPPGIAPAKGLFLEKIIY
jgi:tRNA pseudouridine38-40 synthase